MKLQRPILVGGLGLSFALWLFDTLQDSFVQIGEVSLFSLVAVGGGLFLLKQNRNKNTPEVQEELPQNRSTVENAIVKAEVVVNQLANESQNYPCLTNLREQITQLQTEIDRQFLNVAVTGGKSVGKTTLIKVLQKDVETQNIHFHETPPLFVETTNPSVSTSTSIFDLSLFLTNGDLTESEYQAIEQLKTTNQRPMLVFNKQDQYIPDERATILLALQQRMQEKVIATSAAPVAIKVRKHGDNGNIEEWMEQPAPDIHQLSQQLKEIQASLGQQLIWATTVKKAHLLKVDAKNLLNEVRKERATPIIEQYQWIAAAAAFANPVPALDILATAAINAQMVIDLGGIYQQKFSLDQAKTIATEIGGLMLKLGLVELSTKAISTVLKSNIATYAVGGVIQGVSAAFLTRIAGLALVEYFQAQEVAIETGSAINLDKLRQTLQNVFTATQQATFLQGFVSQGIKRLLPETTEGKINAAQSAA